MTCISLCIIIASLRLLQIRNQFITQFLHSSWWNRSGQPGVHKLCCITGYKCLLTSQPQANKDLRYNKHFFSFIIRLEGRTQRLKQNLINEASEQASYPGEMEANWILLIFSSEFGLLNLVPVDLSITHQLLAPVCIVSLQWKDNRTHK